VTEGRLEIKIKSRFSALHQLRLHGKPEKPHGHNWHVEAFFSAPIPCEPSTHIALASLVKQVVSGLEGKNLMHLKALQHRPPSAENLAAHLYNRMKQEIGSLPVTITQVTVEETPRCRASYISPKQ